MIEETQYRKRAAEYLELAKSSPPGTVAERYRTIARRYEWLADAVYQSAQREFGQAFAEKLANNPPSEEEPEAQPAPKDRSVA